ncbi:hypothetical protein BDR26DRAFT_869067, partial [Obelidium mucronatum]
MYGPAPGGFNNTNNNNNGESIYGAPTNTDSMYYAQSEYGNNTDSMYYGNNTDSVYAPGGGQTESMYVDNNQAADVHIAVYDFSPQMPDEIELRVGDKVQLKHQYDDGWAQGTNLSNGNKTGLFPLDCLEGFDAPQAARRKWKEATQQPSIQYVWRRSRFGLLRKRNGFHVLPSIRNMGPILYTKPTLILYTMEPTTTTLIPFIMETENA